MGWKATSVVMIILYNKLPCVCLRDEQFDYLVLDFWYTKNLLAQAQTQFIQIYFQTFHHFSLIFIAPRNVPKARLIRHAPSRCGFMRICGTLDEPKHSAFANWCVQWKNMRIRVDTNLCESLESIGNDSFIFHDHFMSKVGINFPLKMNMYATSNY